MNRPPADSATVSSRGNAPLPARLGRPATWLSPALLMVGRLPIRLRLAVWFALFLLVSVIGIGVFLLTSLEVDLHREIDEGLHLRASRVEREITLGGNPRLSPGDVRADLLALSPLEEFSLPGIYVQVMNAQGTVLATSPNLSGGNLPLTGALVAEVMRGQMVYATVPASTERVRVLLRPLISDGQTVGAVVVGESLHLVDITQRAARQLLVVAAAAAALGCLGAGWWLTGRALDPVAGVTRIARRIRATGQLDQRIAVPAADDELRELTVTFNEMLDSIEHTFGRQREFLADASHELRGPLMVIRGNLHLLRQSLAEAERQEAIHDAIGEVERISRLVADLLFLAEVDTSELLDRQPVALDQVVAEVWQRARQLDGGAHELALGENRPIEVLGDRERLVQLLWNLVENALRYTPEGGQVTVSLQRSGDMAELTVADTGIGIEAQHQPRIFERFYRADRARPRHEGSTGLGLAIVRQIAEAHGGSVRVESAPGLGSTFTAALPAPARAEA